MNRDISNKVIVITGATDGVGLATATELAKHKPKLVLIARNQKKGDEVVLKLKRESGNDNIEFMKADLSSQKEIRRVVREFKGKYDRLDVLINNVGAVFEKRLETVDGYEMTFALNHLGYFLLTTLLLDTIVESAPARIINVSSMVHTNAKINFDDLNSKKKYSSWSAYATSKLENLYFTYELARKLEDTGVTVNAVHPGLVDSNFGKQGEKVPLFIYKMLTKFGGKTPAEGAKTSIYLALSDEVEGISGEYFANEKLSKSSDLSHDRRNAQKLWEVSSYLVGEK